MDIRKPLTKANVLEKVNQFDIFRFYCPNFTSLNKLFKSELREDNHPTCSIAARSDKLYYRDFATMAKGIDCFTYIQQKFNINFIQSLSLINTDFNLNLLDNFNLSISHNLALKQKTDFQFSDVNTIKVDIKVQIRKWNSADKDYWFGKYDITSKTLKKFNIFPLSGYFINDSYTKCTTITYGYYFGKYSDGREIWKLYQPLSDKLQKWRTNAEYEIQGWDQLTLLQNKDILILTKSLKDILVLYQIGIPAISLQAESHNLDINKANELKSQYKNIFILYDNDETGKNSAESLSKLLSFEVIFMPDGTKDASDFVEMYDLHALHTYLYELICPHIL